MTILNYAAAVPLLWNVCVRGTSVIERNRTTSGALQSPCVFRRTPRPFSESAKRGRSRSSRLDRAPGKPCLRRHSGTQPEVGEKFGKEEIGSDAHRRNSFSRQRLRSGDGLRLCHHGVGQRQKCRRSAPDQQGRAGSKSRRLAPSLRPRQPPGHRHTRRAPAEPLTELPVSVKS